MFGENGRDLARHSKGIDDRPITTEHETKSISQEITYSRDVRDDKVLQKTLQEMSRRYRATARNIGRQDHKLKLRLTHDLTKPP
jgi:DNA polymerase-4